MNIFSFNRFRRSYIRFVMICCLAVSLVLGWSGTVQSQIPSVSSDSSQRALDLPNGVNRSGEYETAAIRSPLDNKTLFEVTSPTIFNREDIPPGKLPVEVRAQEVNERLWRVFYRAVNANQTPVVTVAILNNRPILEIRDDRSTRPIRLVTVTEPDADWNGKTLKELAQEWQKILQSEIARFKQLTTPAAIEQRVRQAIQILLALLLASSVIWFLRRFLRGQQRQLETRYQEQLAKIISTEKNQEVQSKTTSELIEGEEAEAREIADWRSHFLATATHRMSLKHQLDVNKFLKWMLFWLFILMWYVGIGWIIATVPILMSWSLYVWTTPLALIAIWFSVSLTIRLSKSIIDRIMHSWTVNPLLPLGEAQRTTLRSTTIAEALKGLVTFVLVIVGIVWTLGLFNLPTGSILAGGAVIGLAISFGSQSLIKDLVNGCLILIEDQFAIGDVIQVGSKSGLVENLNLRVTQLRSSEGELITIPNSAISDVSNLTRLWSRVDFSILVAYENDPETVLNLLRQISQQMYDEPIWRERLPELPEVLGIDDLSHTGMLVRVWIKTAPMEQWSVGREFRFRVRQAFAANHIQIGRPQRINYTIESSDTLG